MGVTDELLQHNEVYAREFHNPDLPRFPRRRTAVLACMDSRLNVFAVLGLEEGDAHVIRNAGGVVTEDVLRSLTISQHLLKTREIILIHHTDCGMLTFTDEALKRQIESQVGSRPEFAFEAFPDLDENVRLSIARIKACPYIPHTDGVRGFVYEVSSGRLREVAGPSAAGSSPAQV